MAKFVRKWSNNPEKVLLDKFRLQVNFILYL